jgi:hypothetical protein
MKSLRLFVITAVVFATALLLSACSGPTTASDMTLKAKPQSAYLCQVLHRVDRLIVTREAPGNQFVFTFPAVVTVTSASEARAVATSSCALPDVPSGVFHCPAAFAVSYQLDFAVKGEKGMGGEAIDVYPTGCPMVKGLGPVRTPTSAFYQLLARAMALGNVGGATFRGIFNSAHGSLKTGTVVGTFRMVGGPPPGFSLPINGKVVFTPAVSSVGRSVTVQVNNSGLFVTYLAPGVWRVKAESPRVIYNDESWVCGASPISVRVEKEILVAVQCDTP